MEPTKLRIVVTTDPSTQAMEAQMLELDIAARAESIEELLDELRHGILMEYKIAKQHGRVPFVHLTRTPSKYTDQWCEESASDFGSLELPDEVMEALALVLHAPVPRFTFAETKAAA